MLIRVGAFDVVPPGKRLRILSQKLHRRFQ
jgi:hypothetical protein